MIIDFHTHAFPDKLAPKAMKILSSQSAFEPWTDGTVSGLKKSMDEFGIDISVVLGIATNDALGASGKNIGLLHNTKNIFFVPYGQDDPYSKNNSLVCKFDLVSDTVKSALKGEQIQPVVK